MYPPAPPPPRRARPPQYPGILRRAAGGNADLTEQGPMGTELGTMGDAGDDGVRSAERQAAEGVAERERTAALETAVEEASASAAAAQGELAKLRGEHASLGAAHALASRGEHLIFRDLDASGDGKIDRREFHAMMANQARREPRDAWPRTREGLSLIHI